MKKNIFKISALAVILTAVIVAGSLLASGSAGSNDKLNLILEVPSASVESGGTFEVVVRIKNADISAFKLAGLQVDLSYNTDKLTAGAITHTLDTSESTALSNVDGNKVKFVCIKNDFSDEVGYTTLTNLFKVTFTAKEAISNPSALFNKDDITYMMGDTKAVNILNTNSIYSGGNTELAEALINSQLTLEASEKIGGTIVIAPTPNPKDNTAVQKNELENEIANGDVTVTPNDGNVVGTGSKITYNGKEYTVVVKGDIDGDGVVTIFDAIHAGKGDQFTEDKKAEEYAADVNGDGVINEADINVIFGHASEKNPIN